MTNPRLRVAVIGAGQAGLTLSRRLESLGIDHVVFEREQVASAWRRRWDSFSLVTPNALVALPGAARPWSDPDGYLARDDVVAWLESYAAPIAHRIVTADVQRVARRDDGFALETSAGAFRAATVVVCTGLGRPARPACAAELGPGVAQLHTDELRSASALDDGGVLVVGSGQSGVQVAAELLAAGRRVVVAAGACGWVPRRYLDRDILVWAEEIGFYDRRVQDLRNPRLSRASCQPQLTGQHGGGTLNLATLAASGALLVGRVDGVLDADTIAIGDNLEKSLRFGDEFAKNFMGSIDAHARTLGIATTSAGYGLLPWQGHVRSGQDVRRLSLSSEGIRTIVWATGYAPDFSFLEGVERDDDGYPRHERGVSPWPGLFFLGLPYQTRRSSALIHGVGDDADAIAQLIAR